MHAFRLGLPLSLRLIHPVFHASLLELASTSAIPNRVINPPPPVEIKDSTEYEVLRILDSKVDRRQKGNQILYLMEWKGYEDANDPTSWEPAENLRNAPELVQAFHKAYPAKPKP
jgi:hypothetical protein